MSELIQSLEEASQDKEKEFFFKNSNSNFLCCVVIFRFF